MVVSERSVVSFINYLRHEKRFSEHTVLAYQSDIKQFYTFIKQSDDESGTLIQAGYQDIRAWIVELMMTGMTARTVNRKISTLRSFYNFLKRKGIVSSNPTSRITAPRTGKRLPNYLKEQEVDDLFTTVAFEDSLDGQRDLLILRLLYECGLRRAELISLKTDDIDLKKKVIKVMGKGSKERLIPISEDLAANIDTFLDMKEAASVGGECPHLFVTGKGQPLYPKFVYNLVVKYLGQVTTLDKKSPHVLRHSFATHLTNGGAEIKAVKDLLGHASLAATQVYTHNSIEKLKKAYKGAHPKA